MTNQQATYIIGHLLMQANVAGRLPLSVKAAGEDLTDWPPRGGIPSDFTTHVSTGQTEISFKADDGTQRFRISIEKID